MSASPAPTSWRGTIGIVAEQIECVPFTMAHAMAGGGWRVRVMTDAANNTLEGNENYRRYLLSVPGVSIEYGVEPGEMDLLFVESTPKAPLALVRQASRQAKRIAAITYIKRPTLVRTILAQLKQGWRAPGPFLRTRRFIYVNGHRPIDLHMLLGSRRNLGFDVHPRFFLEEALRKKMFTLDWTPARPRRYRLIYVGSNCPPERALILDRIRAALDTSGRTMVESHSQPGDILWLQGKPLEMDAYCDVLAETDCTLCPPGYLQVTYRVMESLIRGSIPILPHEDLDLYDFGLKDGVNCMTVKQGRWEEASLAALAANEADLRRMRERIVAMREDYLTIAASDRRIRVRLGLE